MITTISVGHAT